jgi:hypothetical protein
LSDLSIKQNSATCVSVLPSLNSELKISVEDIINAMEVVGFQDQGREKVAEVIQDKFQELTLGNVDCIPPELFEYTDVIMGVIGYLSQVST